MICANLNSTTPSIKKAAWLNIRSVISPSGLFTIALLLSLVTEKHGGTLQCFSQPGQGAEFVITILVRQTG